MNGGHRAWRSEGPELHHGAVRPSQLIASVRRVEGRMRQMNGCGAFLLWLGVILLVSPSRASAAPSCTPSFRRVVDMEIRYPGGWSMMSGSAVVIGCAEVLDALAPADTAKMRSALSRVLEEDGPGMIGRQDDTSVRTKTAARINTIVGRTVAADVAFYGLGYSDLGYVSE